MKIEIELPIHSGDENKDWFIIKGTEQVAYFTHREKVWHVKTSSCVQCGKCCMNLPKGQYPLDENKDCVHLGQDGPDKKPCRLGAMRPFSCIEGDPVKGTWGKDFCSIRYNGEK